jgi:hypothetical protein
VVILALVVVEMVLAVVALAAVETIPLMPVVAPTTTKRSL